ncbi:MAG: polyprenol phosphomannose-dependent alpha 1,6 mannosyltransferase MptB [Candidatus Promineifilaceae bacterium]|nr:polyprenol phosphomannose-dependent alpha 1,6 mannosyltransferase MptB [Candidatus Promineifilaceae bacterium]
MMDWSRRLQLPLLALLSFAGYTLLALNFPLVPFYRQLPLSDVRTFTPSLVGGVAYALLLLALFALFALGYHRVRHKGTSLRLLVLVTALFALPLLFTYPINANDIFRYFVRARILTVHGASPLAVPPAAFPDDAFLQFAGEWVDETSPYGPVWELTAAAVSLVAGKRLLLALLLLKGLALLAHLGSGVLIWRLLPAHKAEQRAASTLLWLWNPALLLIFVVNGHNDGLMLFWLLLGWWVIVRGQRPLTGFLILILGPLTKLIALLPLPYLFLGVWRALPEQRQRWRFLLLAPVGAAALGILAFLPFGSPIELGLRLVREASGGAGFSPLALLVLLSRRLGTDLSLGAANVIGTLLFLAITLWLLWRSGRERRPLGSAGDIFAAYLFTAATFRLWYAVWPFPWYLLDQGHRRDAPAPDGQPLEARLVGNLLFLLLTQISVVLYGHLRVYLLGGNHLAAHLIGVPATFALPLLVAVASQRSRR